MATFANHIIKYDAHGETLVKEVLDKFHYGFYFGNFREYYHFFMYTLNDFDLYIREHDVQPEALELANTQLYIYARFDMNQDLRLMTELYCLVRKIPNTSIYLLLQKVATIQEKMYHDARFRDTSFHTFQLLLSVAKEGVLSEPDFGICTVLGPRR